MFGGLPEGKLVVMLNSVEFNNKVLEKELIVRESSLDEARTGVVKAGISVTNPSPSALRSKPYANYTLASSEYDETMALLEAGRFAAKQLTLYLADKDHFTPLDDEELLDVFNPTAGRPPESAQIMKQQLGFNQQWPEEKLAQQRVRRSSEKKKPAKTKPRGASPSRAKLDDDAVDNLSVAFSGM